MKMSLKIKLATFDTQMNVQTVQTHLYGFLSGGYHQKERVCKILIKSTQQFTL